MSKKVCNMDCFNCKFSDCINDDFSSLEERKQSNNIDIQNRQDGSIPRSTKYYREHPERCRAYQLKSINKHRDKVYERNRKYQQEHREEVLAQKRAYYKNNRERILAYQKSKYEPHPRTVIDTPQAESKRQSSKASYYRNREEINRRRREKRRLLKEKKENANYN